MKRATPILLSVVLGCASVPRAPLASPVPALMRVQAPRAPLDVRDGAVPCTEAIRFAWTNAPRVRAASALAAVADVRRAELRAGYLPQVNAAALATTGFSGSGSNLGVRGMMSSPFVNQWAAGLEGSWSALEFLRIEPRVDVTYAEEHALKGEQARIERDVAFMVLDVYERALTVEATLDVLAADISARQAHLSALEALVNVGGIASPTDLLQARAMLARSEADRAAARADRDGLRAVLVTLVGDERMATAMLTIDTPAKDAIDAPDLVVSRAQREVARRLRDIAWRDLLPRVVVGGSVGYAHRESPQDPGLYAAGVAVALPLTGIFAERPRQEALALQADSRAYDADARAQEIEIRRATLRATLQALGAALPSAEASTKAARDALVAVEARAKGGLVREIEVESARAILAQAKVNEASLRVRVSAARARLVWIGG